MDFNVLLGDMRIAADNLRKGLSNRKYLSSVYCNKTCKAVDKTSAASSEYDNVIAGLWAITAHLIDQVDYLDAVPAIQDVSLRLFRECSKAVLNIQWQNLEEENAIRQNFLVSLASLNKKLVKRNFHRFHLLESLTENPWTDPTLAKIMGGEAEDEEEKEEVRKYIENEDPVILQLRVDMMLKENCEEYAMNLCNSCLIHPELKSDLKLRKTQLTLLYKLGHTDRLQEECQKLSIQDALVIIRQLQTKVNREICTVLSQTFMVQNWIRPSDQESNKELLRLWIKQQVQVDKEKDRFKESAWAIAKLSQSTEQIIFFIDVLREQCGGEYLQLYMDMCVFAINVDKGQMETSKRQGNSESAIARKHDMAAICSKLACLVHHASIKVARMCVLTAFALKPSEDSYELVGKFYGTEQNCCGNCTKHVNADPGTVNPATLYEVERLLNMLRPDFLCPDNTLTSVQTLCKRYLQEKLIASKNIFSTLPLNSSQVEGPGKKKEDSKPFNFYDPVSPHEVSESQVLLSKLRLIHIQNTHANPHLIKGVIYSEAPKPSSWGNIPQTVTGRSNVNDSGPKQVKSMNINKRDGANAGSYHRTPIKQDHRPNVKIISTTQPPQPRQQQQSVSHLQNRSAQPVPPSANQVVGMDYPRQQPSVKDQNKYFISSSSSSSSSGPHHNGSVVTNSASQLGKAKTPGALGLLDGRQIKSISVVPQKSFQQPQQHKSHPTSSFLPQSGNSSVVNSLQQPASQILPTVSTLLKSPHNADQRQLPPKPSSLSLLSSSSPSASSSSYHQSSNPPRNQSPSSYQALQQTKGKNVEPSPSHKPGNNATSRNVKTQALHLKSLMEATMFQLQPLQKQQQVFSSKQVPNMNQSAQGPMNTNVPKQSAGSQVKSSHQAAIASLQSKLLIPKSSQSQLLSQQRKTTQATFSFQGQPSQALAGRQPGQVLNIRQRGQMLPRQQAQTLPRQQGQTLPRQQGQTLPRQQAQTLPRHQGQMLPRQQNQPVMTHGRTQQPPFSSLLNSGLTGTLHFPPQPGGVNVSLEISLPAESQLQNQTAVPSDELSGSITGIDDTIITELLQDSGIFSNTFPDIDVEGLNKKQQEGLQPKGGSVPNRSQSSRPNTAKSQIMSAMPAYNTNPIGISPVTSNVRKSGASNVFNPSFDIKHNNFVQNSLAMPKEAPRMPHVDSNTLNQRQFPLDIERKGVSQSPRSGLTTVEQLREKMRNEQIEGEVTMDSSNNATYRCIICSLAFAELEELREHVRNVCKPGLQSSSVYNNKIEQDREKSARAGLETTTVFQCLRCFELCISQAGIQNHRLTCKRVPTVPPDIMSASQKGKSSPSSSSSRSSTPKIPLIKKEPKDNSSKVPEMSLTSSYPSLSVNTKALQESLFNAASKPQTSPMPVANVRPQGVPLSIATMRPQMNVTTSTVVHQPMSTISATSVNQRMSSNFATSVNPHSSSNFATSVNPHSSSISPATLRPQTNLFPVASTVNPQTNPVPAATTTVSHQMNPLSASPIKPTGSIVNSRVNPMCAATVKPEPSPMSATTIKPEPSPMSAAEPASTSTKSPHQTNASPSSSSKGQSNVPSQPEEEKPKLPPPSYSEISGSGGSKFYRCKLCSQTLCSLESLFSHWKECFAKSNTVKKAPSHKSFLYADDLEPGEIRPLFGSMLENVVSVIAAVARGQMGNTQDFDSDAEASDFDALAELEDPCKVHHASSSFKSFLHKDSFYPNQTNFPQGTHNVHHVTSDSSKLNPLPVTTLPCELYKSRSLDKVHPKNSSKTALSNLADYSLIPEKVGILKRTDDSEDVSSSGKEDESQSLSEFEVIDDREDTDRETPPKLRDRNTLKPIQSYINESFVSPYSKVMNKKKTDVHTSKDAVTRDNSSEESEESHVCVACKKPCQNERILIQHYAGKHLQPYTMKTLTDSSSYFCHLCQKSFSTFKHYMLHVPNHSAVIFNKMKNFSSGKGTANPWSRRLANSRGFTSRQHSAKKGKLSPKLASALKSKKKAARSARDRLKKCLTRRSLLQSSSSPLLFNAKDSQRTSPSARRFRRSLSSGVTTRGSPGRSHLSRHCQSVTQSLPQSDNDDSYPSSNLANTDDDDYLASEDCDSDSLPSAPPQTRNRKRSGQTSSDRDEVRKRRSFSFSTSPVSCSSLGSKDPALLPIVSLRRMSQDEIVQYLKGSVNDEPKGDNQGDLSPTSNSSSQCTSSFQASFESYLRQSFTSKTRPRRTRSASNTSRQGQLLAVEDSCDHEGGESSDRTSVADTEESTDSYTTQGSMDVRKDQETTKILSSLTKRRCSVNLGQKLDIRTIQTLAGSTDDNISEEEENPHSSVNDSEETTPVEKPQLNLPTCAVLLERTRLAGSLLEFTKEEQDSAILSTESRVGPFQEEEEQDSAILSTESKVRPFQEEGEQDSAIPSTESNVGPFQEEEEQNSTIPSTESNVGPFQEKEEQDPAILSTESNVGPFQEEEEQDPAIPSMESNVGPFQEKETEREPSGEEIKEEEQNTESHEKGENGSTKPVDVSMIEIDVIKEDTSHQISSKASPTSYPLTIPSSSDSLPRQQSSEVLSEDQQPFDAKLTPKSPNTTKEDGTASLDLMDVKMDGFWLHPKMAMEDGSVDLSKWKGEDSKSLKIEFGVDLKDDPFPSDSEKKEYPLEAKNESLEVHDESLSTEAAACTFSPQEPFCKEEENQEICQGDEDSSSITDTGIDATEKLVGCLPFPPIQADPSPSDSFFSEVAADFKSSTKVGSESESSEIDPPRHISFDKDEKRPVLPSVDLDEVEEMRSEDVTSNEYMEEPHDVCEEDSLSIKEDSLSIKEDYDSGASLNIASGDEICKELSQENSESRTLGNNEEDVERKTSSLQIASDDEICKEQSQDNSESRTLGNIEQDVERKASHGSHGNVHSDGALNEADPHQDISTSAKVVTDEETCLQQSHGFSPSDRESSERQTPGMNETDTGREDEIHSELFEDDKFETFNEDAKQDLLNHNFVEESSNVRDLVIPDVEPKIEQTNENLSSKHFTAQNCDKCEFDATDNEINERTEESNGEEEVPDSVEKDQEEVADCVEKDQEESSNVRDDQDESSNVRDMMITDMDPNNVQTSEILFTAHNEDESGHDTTDNKDSERTEESNGEEELAGFKEKDQDEHESIIERERALGVLNKQADSSVSPFCNTVENKSCVNSEDTMQLVNESCADSINKEDTVQPVNVSCANSEDTIQVVNETTPDLSTAISGRVIPPMSASADDCHPELKDIELGSEEEELSMFSPSNDDPIQKENEAKTSDLEVPADEKVADENSSDEEPSAADGCQEEFAAHTDNQTYGDFGLEARTIDQMDDGQCVSNVAEQDPAMTSNLSPTVSTGTFPPLDETAEDNILEGNGIPKENHQLATAASSITSPYDGQHCGESLAENNKLDLEVVPMVGQEGESLYSKETRNVTDADDFIKGCQVKGPKEIGSPAISIAQCETSDFDFDLDAGQHSLNLGEPNVNEERSFVEPGVLSPDYSQMAPPDGHFHHHPDLEEHEFSSNMPDCPNDSQTYVKDLQLELDVEDKTLSPGGMEQKVDDESKENVSLNDGIITMGEGMEKDCSENCDDNTPVLSWSDKTTASDGNSSSSTGGELFPDAPSQEGMIQADERNENVPTTEEGVDTLNCVERVSVIAGDSLQEEVEEGRDSLPEDGEEGSSQSHKEDIATATLSDEMTLYKGSDELCPDTFTKTDGSALMEDVTDVSRITSPRPLSPSPDCVSEPENGILLLCSNSQSADKFEISSQSQSMEPYQMPKSELTPSGLDSQCLLEDLGKDESPHHVEDPLPLHTGTSLPVEFEENVSSIHPSAGKEDGKTCEEDNSSRSDEVHQRLEGEYRQGGKSENDALLQGSGVTKETVLPGYETFPASPESQGTPNSSEENLEFIKNEETEKKDFNEGPVISKDCISSPESSLKDTQIVLEGSLFQAADEVNNGNELNEENNTAVHSLTDVEEKLKLTEEDSPLFEESRKVEEEEKLDSKGELEANFELREEEQVNVMECGSNTDLSASKENDEDDLSDYDLVIEEDSAYNKNVFNQALMPKTSKHNNDEGKDSSATNDISLLKKQYRKLPSELKSRKEKLDMHRFEWDEMEDESLMSKQRLLERKQNALKGKSETPFMWDLEDSPDKQQCSERKTEESDICKLLGLEDEKASSPVPLSPKLLKKRERKPKLRAVGSADGKEKLLPKKRSASLPKDKLNTKRTKLATSDSNESLASETQVALPTLPKRRGRPRKTVSAEKVAAKPDKESPLLPANIPSVNDVIVDDEISFNTKSYSPVPLDVPRTKTSEMKQVPSETQTRGRKRLKKVEASPKIETPGPLSELKDIGDNNEKFGRNSGPHSTNMITIKRQEIETHSLSPEAKRCKLSSPNKSVDPLTPKLKKAGLIRVTNTSTPPPPDNALPFTRASEAALKAFNKKSLRNREVHPTEEPSPSRNSTKSLQERKSLENLAKHGKNKSPFSPPPLPSSPPVRVVEDQVSSAIFGGNHSSPRKSNGKQTTAASKQESPTAAVVKRRTPSIPRRNSKGVFIPTLKRGPNGKSKQPSQGTTTIYRVDPVLPKGGGLSSKSPSSTNPPTAPTSVVHTPLPAGVTSVRSASASPRRKSKAKWKIEKDVKSTKLKTKSKQSRSQISFRKT